MSEGTQRDTWFSWIHTHTHTHTFFSANGAHVWWLSGQPSPQPPAVSEERPQSPTPLPGQTSSSLSVHAVFKNHQHLPTASKAPTNQKQTLNEIATHCMFGSHSS